MKITREILIEIAKRYCVGNISIGELSKLYGVSKTTLVRHFEGQYDYTRLSPSLQEEVDRVKEKNWIEGKSTSGNLGHNKFTASQVRELAKEMVRNNLTLRDLGEVNDVSGSILYNLFNAKILGDELYAEVTGLYNSHKKRK